jgi:hypothetical protein
MVELQRSRVAVISTDHAPAARLGDQDRLDLASSGGDILRPALSAPVVATFPSRNEGRHSMSPTSSPDLIGAVGTSTSQSPQPVASQPVPNGGDADAQLTSDFSEAQALGDEMFEIVPGDSPSGRVFRSIDCDEPMLLEPVGDSGRVAVHDSPDPLQGKPFGQIPLEQRLLHTARLRPEPDGKSEHMFPSPATPSAAATPPRCAVSSGSLTRSAARARGSGPPGRRCPRASAGPRRRAHSAAR